MCALTGASGCAAVAARGDDVAVAARYGEATEGLEAAVRLAARELVGRPADARLELEPGESSVMHVVAAGERWALVFALCHHGEIDPRVRELFTGLLEACLGRVVAAEQLVSGTAPAAPPPSADTARGGRGAPRGTARASFDDLLGMDPTFLACVELARRAATSDLPLLITGETGSGKEMLAQALHNASPRRTRAFVGINVAAIPRELLESELFGYDRGAFTGARTTGKPGLFELAGDGTLLLDEIGDMPLELQVKLLGSCRSASSSRSAARGRSAIRARIISTTHHDLREATRTGTFRADLYYRLRGVHLRVPSLRERPSDIPLLVDECLARFAARHGCAKPHVAPRVIAAYMEHDWPGNVRELMHLVEAEASVLAPGTGRDQADADALPAPPARATGGGGVGDGDGGGGRGGGHPRRAVNLADGRRRTARLPRRAPPLRGQRLGGRPRARGLARYALQQDAPVRARASRLGAPSATEPQGLIGARRVVFNGGAAFKT